MATLAQLREGLATNLDTLDGVQVSAYMLGSPTPPAIHVIPSEISYDLAMQRGLDTWTFTVQAFVGTGLDKAAQIRLDKMLAPSGVDSVKAAIEADRTLGGVASDLHVTEVSSYIIVTRSDGSQLLSADWTVVVVTQP